MSAVCLLGTVAGIVVLSLIGFALVLFCKRRGFRIPKIRKASGPMSLFGSEERRSHPRVEEGFALQRPLLYVRGFLFPLLNLLTWMGVVSGSHEPSDVLAGQRRARETLTAW